MFESPLEMTLSDGQHVDILCRAMFGLAQMRLRFGLAHMDLSPYMTAAAVADTHFSVLFVPRSLRLRWQAEHPESVVGQCVKRATASISSLQTQLSSIVAARWEGIGWKGMRVCLMEQMTPVGGPTGAAAASDQRLLRQPDGHAAAAGPSDAGQPSGLQTANEVFQELLLQCVDDQENHRDETVQVERANAVQLMSALASILRQSILHATAAATASPSPAGGMFKLMLPCCELLVTAGEDLLYKTAVCTWADLRQLLKAAQPGAEGLPPAQALRCAMHLMFPHRDVLAALWMTAARVLGGLPAPLEAVLRVLRGCTAQTSLRLMPTLQIHRCKLQSLSRHEFDAARLALRLLRLVEGDAGLKLHLVPAESNEHYQALQESVDVGVAECHGAGCIMSALFTQLHRQSVGPVRLARLLYKKAVPEAIRRLSAAVGSHTPRTPAALVHRSDMVIHVQGNIDVALSQRQCFSALYQGHCENAQCQICSNNAQSQGSSDPDQADTDQDIPQDNSDKAHIQATSDQGQREGKADKENLQSNSDKAHIQAVSDKRQCGADSDKENPQSDSDNADIQATSDQGQREGKADKENLQSNSDKAHIQAVSDKGHCEADSDKENSQSDSDNADIQATSDQGQREGKSDKPLLPCETSDKALLKDASDRAQYKGNFDKANFLLSDLGPGSLVELLDRIDQLCTAPGALSELALPRFECDRLTPESPRYPKILEEEADQRWLHGMAVVLRLVQVAEREGGPHRCEQ
eukprot:jgi/Ulvmu1/8138/UM040_0034.1